jgi:coenzyme PQQ precursor peptide PqqA
LGAAATFKPDISRAATEVIDRPSLYPQTGDSLNFLFALQHGTATNNSLANFQNRITLSLRTKNVPPEKENEMSWKTPKIVEVPVGMEINMYACAARK